MLKITHLSSAPFQGGAARAGYRLHQSLRERVDIESTWVDAGPGPHADDTHIIKRRTPSRSLIQRLKRRIVKNPFDSLPKPTRTICSDPSGWGVPEDLCVLERPDVWNLHWVSWFLEWDLLLPWLAEQAPIVWTLHDLNPLRGIWHYEPDQQELQPPWSLLEASALERKRRALDRIPRTRLCFVGPSTWMAEQVRQCPVARTFPVHTIPYGLNTDVFLPLDRAVLRRMAEIEDGWLVLGCLADTLTEPRKGIAELSRAVRELPEDLKVHVVTAGRGDADFGNKRHTHLGSLQTDRLLALFYSGCDLFVCPSLQDNLPNTVLESLSCGTPVLAYHTGGLPDMVRADQSGLCVEPVGDWQSLQQGIQKLLADPGHLARLRTKCRELSVTEYSLGTQALAYRLLYTEYVDHPPVPVHPASESFIPFQNSVSA